MVFSAKMSLIAMTPLVTAALVSPCLAQQGQDTRSMMAEAEWDWRPGDLIFRNDLNSFDDAVRAVEGSDWASVGILRASSGGPRVVFVDEKVGVTEVMLDVFIEDISSDAYGVYRVQGVETQLPDGQHIQGPIATYSLFIAYGSPYDALVRFGNGRYYNAELPFEAALNAGVVLGAPKPIADLAFSGNEVWQRIMGDWENNPYCVAATTIDECWSFTSDAAMMTAGVLIASSRLDQVYP